MSFFRIATYVILIVLLILASVIFRSRPQYLGEIDHLSVQNDTEVLFDSFGIPHIYGQTKQDAYRALGYVHAQDRLFQMELLRRAGGGRLSEVFGPDLIEVDKLFRTLGVHRKAEYEAERARNESSQAVLECAEAYLEGVNTYVDEGRSPMEFMIAGIPKEHFTISDMHLIAGAMSFNFAQGLRTDPLMSYIKDVLGPEYLEGVQVHTPDQNINVPLYPEYPKEVVSPPIISQYPKSISSGIEDYFSIGLPTFYGSNTWVTSPWKTEDGVTLLANDTHIGYGQPCTWYEAHLEYPGHRIYGNFMGGIPFALTGHNVNGAWGVTMLLNDDMDLYCEELSQDGKKYRFKDKWLPIKMELDTIFVKGMEPIVLSSQYTHHGPLISEFVKHVDSTEHISMRWTYLDLDSDLLVAFHDMNHAADMDDARTAISKISAPGLNISWGDPEGNIALWAAARLLDRPDYIDPSYMLDGANGMDEVPHYIPFEMNPTLENPPWGYVYSCNNQHESYGEGGLQRGYYEPDDRASRLMQKLRARNDWSMEAMKQLATDTYSKKNKELCTDLVEVLRSQQLSMNETEEEAFQKLKEWEGGHHIEEVAPSIYYRWVYAILKNLMQDELGEEAFAEFLKTNIVKASFSKLLCDDESPWWDNVKTEKHESREDGIVSSFRTIIEKMVEDNGPDVSFWTWGNTHQTIHKHAFNDLPLLGKWMSVGPMEAPGGIETLNNSVFYLSDDAVLYSQYGPQMRRVIDLSNIENSQSILPTGNSGMRMSPHYEDQAEAYLKGSFRPQMMDRKKIEQKSQLLVFRASEQN